MPFKLYVYVGGALMLLALIAGYTWKVRHDEAARWKPKVEAARAEASKNALETQGERDTAQRVEVVIRTKEAAQQSVSTLSRKALEAPDANQPLSPDRAQRLLDHDRWLCSARPALGGCAAASDPG